MRIALGVLLTLALVGCRRDESELRTQAEWLCHYNQLTSPTLESFPEGVQPSEHLRKEDLEFLQKHGAGGNPISQGMKAALAPGMQALAEGMSKHTDCEVTVMAVSDDSAMVSVKRLHPDLGPTDFFGRLGELTQMGSKEARLARVDAWAQASPRRETTHALSFVRTQDGWRVRYDLQAQAEERKRAQAVAELKSLTQKKLAAEKARVELARFPVTRSLFRKVAVQSGEKKPLIDISVKNDLEQRISHVAFRGVLTGPASSTPVLQANFEYAIPGGLEPGASADWTLSPGVESDWGRVAEAPNLKLALEVVRVDGADGRPLYSAEFGPADQQRLSSLEARFNH
ncbi:hypothetical protein JGU66_04805 [Myxococcaceae bacterium JPH2]|nr:hypothetical protein [Myxococcaceae bacterium JPH2]